MPVITLTTDFGLSDWFVGTMKGVIASITPGTPVVDISHEIPPGDIRAGAFVLAAGCHSFPKGTIHMAVVDPGVGGRRRAVAVRTKNYIFVGPDNGLLSFALARENSVKVHQITNVKFRLKDVSSTFHGRDIFAPAAAHLSRGVPIQSLGPELRDLNRLPQPEPIRFAKKVRGEVIYADRFGNAITNIDERALADLSPSSCDVIVNRQRVCRFGTHYQAASRGRAIAVLNSCGLVEIAINGGSAAKSLRLRPGTMVTIQSK